MRVLALTGGIGSGKSTFSQILQNQGACLQDADKITKDTQKPGTPIFKKIVTRWGEKILASDGTLNREALGNIVFTKPEEKKELEALIHPAVRETILTELQKQQTTNTTVVLELPLLQANDFYMKLVAGTIVVDCPIPLVLQRLQELRNMSKEHAEARIASQISREERLLFADYVIDNSKNIEHLHAQTDRCWKWIQTLPNMSEKQLAKFRSTKY